MLTKQLPALRFYFKKVLLALFWLAVPVICVFLFMDVNEKISGSRITGDAYQNTRMAFNFYHYNVLSTESRPDPSPTNCREPLPPLVAGLFMKAHPGIHKEMPFASFSEGLNARSLKQVNVFWVFAGLVGMWGVVFLLSSNSAMALLSILLSYHFFFGVSLYVDRMYTEIPAATLMIWASFFLLWGTKSKNVLLFILSGAFMGLLALTKAVFFYVSLGAIFLIFVYFIFGRKEFALAKRAIICLIIIVSFLSVTGPWMVRNKIHFDRAEITQRGGVVLLVRAYKNQMNAQEIAGALYLWGPGVYRILVRNTFLEANWPNDYEKGQPLQHVKRIHSQERLAESLGDPSIACSFYTKARAMRVKMRRDFAAAGHENPRHAADEYLKSKAALMIVQNPGRHLLMTAPFAWRGLWCFSSYNIPFSESRHQKSVVELINFSAGLSLFGLFIYGFARRRYGLIAVTLIPVGMLVFYMLFSHNIPRYSSPAVPFMLISLVFLVYAGTNAAWKRIMEGANR